MRRSAVPFCRNGQASEGSADRKAWLELTVSAPLDGEVSGVGMNNCQ